MKRIIAPALLLATFLAPNLTHAADGHFKNHTIGVFAGATFNDGDSENSYGLEYEYKFNRDWGVGLVYEKTPDAHHDDGVTIQLASVYAHLTENWRIGLGFGQEKVGGSHSFTENLIRTSVSYDFHLGNFGIAPSLAFDTVDGETATVVGVAFLVSF
ncbi:MAG: hypothetical protein HRU22_13070 [Gammaproteobacteria bacterium]|nr:hypothetical protein [Gammaproteobacteria bacterium]